MTNSKIINKFRAMDGNEAAAHVAYRTNEICIIFPITPASVMGELPDQWVAEGLKNIWGVVPEVVEMQSEAGAAGALHGAVQTGALATTFTASQGLLLMVPNMFRIAGDLSPTVFHVSSRAVAAQGMSIYCDHSDSMATRMTGFAMLSSASVQEAHDMALIAQAASLESRVPFLHFFDGFRTSHEVSKIELLSDEQIRGMIDEDLVIKNRERRLTSDNPSVRGLVQDADTYFQSRETVNPFYAQLPGTIEKAMQRFQELTGRGYQTVEYYGHPEAEKVIVLMGSAAETALETVEYLAQQGEKVGMLKVVLFRPFPEQRFLEALPKTCKAIAILDRTKEPGAQAEPLFEEVATALFENHINKKSFKIKGLEKVIGGRYGIASKEFTPAMIKSIFAELGKEKSIDRFTIGIIDDVANTSLTYEQNFDIESDDVIRAVFYGLGADGTVSANKNTVKIISDETDLYTQAYFVYDAKKSGSKTTSYLRFGPKKIRSTYLISAANFIGCHQFTFAERMPVLERAATGATFLLNSPYSATEVWDHLPRSLQQTIIDKKIKFYVVDGYKVAKESGMGGHINTIMQTCFFALSNVLPRDLAIEKIKAAIKKTYASKGEAVIKKNFAAVDNTLANLVEVKVPSNATSTFDLPSPVHHSAPEFVRDVIGKMVAGKGDELPVSAIPVDGTYPSHSTCYEKRNIANMVPVWNSEECIQCGQCSVVCPHSIIRAKRFSSDLLKDAPKGFKCAKLRGQNSDNESYSMQIYLEDCSGCTACLEVCPVNQGKSGKKALTMHSRAELVDAARTELEFFEKIPGVVQHTDKNNVRGIQFVEPQFEFCAACAGCGEAAYVKLLTKLLGDRLIVADACGCTLVYCGYLPTSPWTVNQEGRGPAFGASLFEDNAEFAFGYLLTEENHRRAALKLLDDLAPEINAPQLITAIKSATQRNDTEILAQRDRVTELKALLHKSKNPAARQLLSLADQLVKHSMWALGGDGWAYDIGFGGLDHVLASGRNIKCLVLDTEVYSNTGGQASKSSPRGAVVKFAAQGKPSAKKDLGMMMMTYGNVYIAHISLGANPNQAIKALQEAEHYDGPALVIAYSHCIAHGISMHKGLQQQQLAVKSGYWPLYRYNPDRIKQGLNPFQLDSAEPSIPLSEYTANENRFQILARSNPEQAKALLRLAEDDVARKWKMINRLLKD